MIGVLSSKDEAERISVTIMEPMTLRQEILNQVWRKLYQTISS